jgi:hypothetical protein
MGSRHTLMTSWAGDAGDGRFRDYSGMPGAGARTITQRVTLVRQRTQPTAETIVRLTVTAAFAYLVALLNPARLVRCWRR